MPSTYSDKFPLHLIQECERLNPIVCLTVLLFALSLLVSVMVGLYLIYVTLAILEISIVALSVVALNLSVQMEMLIDWAFLYIPTGAPVLGVSVPRTPSQAAHNPVLPMELQDTIIHICDKSTLSSCSLVCSTWLPLCRRRMTFAVQSRHHTAELGRLLRNSRETISPYLRHLIISSEREAGNTSGLLQHKRLLRLLWLKHAPLQSVILLNTLPAVIALSQYFPNITSLSYRLSRPPEFWGGILDFRNLLTVVPAFHQLISLSFDDQWILPSLRPGEDKQISGGPLPITNVEIRTSFPAIFPVLRQLEKRCKNLVSFYCDIPLISYGSDMSEEVATINNILKCNRQTLLHLSLPVHSGRSSTSVYNLSHSTFLKTLHLVLYGAPIAQHFAADSLITLDTEQIEQVVVSEGYRGALSALPAIDEVLIGRSRFTRIPQSYTSVAYSNVSFW